MNVVLFDESEIWKNLLPLTFTRPVSEIRIGILSIKQKWDKHLKTSSSYLTQDFLSQKFNSILTDDTLFINASVCPDEKLVTKIQKLTTHSAICYQNKLVAFRGNQDFLKNTHQLSKTEIEHQPLIVEQVWDIFQKNAQALIADFQLLTQNKKSAAISNSVTIVGDAGLVFFEEGAKAEACVLNTSGGPIYIGKNAEIMEGSLIRGPFALGENSTLKLGTKIYGATTIGPECKVGGEVSNSVIFGFTNKAHDGFIGNSILGEWCNLGADTNTSNLKNNYATVKVYNYVVQKSIDSGQQFCGLIMGDHSKSGINTMFNTGTVVGVAANVFGGGFPPTHIPSFSWGGSEGFEKYQPNKFFETAIKVYERRHCVLGEVDRQILSHISTL